MRGKGKKLNGTGPGMAVLGSRKPGRRPRFTERELALQKQRAEERKQLTEERIAAIVKRCEKEIEAFKKKEQSDALTRKLAMMSSEERLGFINETVRKLFAEGWTLTLRKGDRENFTLRNYRSRLPKNFQPVSLQMSTNGESYNGMCYLGNSEEVNLFFLKMP